MIDLHSHILPGVDDGASDMAASLEMARRAYEEGITTLLATPHHQNGRYVNTKEQAIRQTGMLQSVIDQAGIDLKILPGQEVRLFGELLEDYQDGEILGLNDSKYILVEFPSSGVPAFAEKMLFDMQLQGLIPVIAHPERNSEIIERPNTLYKLVKNGALAQVTAASLNGQFGKKIKKFSNQLVEANLVHFVAGDAHNISTRGFGLGAAYESLHPAYAEMYKENAEAVIANRFVAKEPPHHVQTKKKIFGLF